MQVDHSKSQLTDDKLRYALYRLQPAHAVAECILRGGGSDEFFPIPKWLWEVLSSKAKDFSRSRTGCHVHWKSGNISETHC